MTDNVTIEIYEEEGHTEEETFIQDKTVETKDDNEEEKKKAKVEKEVEVRKKVIDIQIRTLYIIHSKGNRLKMACKEI